MTLTFTYDEINNRYDKFVQNFMSGETNVERTQLLPRFWIVSVPSKGFRVSITCECTGLFHGIEEWCAIVEESNGEKTQFLLFEKEIDQWAVEIRRQKEMD